MNRVTSEELSAYLDGELSSERAADVCAALDIDPSLRAEYSALRELDAQLLSAAEAGMFVPRVTLLSASTISAWSGAAGAGLILALLGVRFLPKIIDAVSFGIGLQLAALAAILVVTVRLALASAAEAPVFSKGLPA